MIMMKETFIIDQIFDFPFAFCYFFPEFWNLLDILPSSDVD